jgi:anti-sigma-K factor RskA
MNYGNEKLLEELAAQYVLGTLRGSARTRFERICETDPTALLAVQRWEDRLIDRLHEVAPVTPSALTWERVRLRIRTESARARRRAADRKQLPRFALAAAVAVLAVVLGWWNWMGPGSREMLAVVTTEAREPLWRIEARRGREALFVIAGEDLTLDPARAYELWALPGPNAAPVSLGLMPRSGRSTLALNEDQRLALSRAGQVAISLEPPGGSPTGAPTGPVLYVADVILEG